MSRFDELDNIICFSSKWSICNNYNTKFYCYLRKSRGVASIFILHAPASRKLLELRHLLNSLIDYCHLHHHQHLYFIGTDVSAVSNGWLRLLLRLLLSSPVFITDLLFCLHGWPTTQLLMGDLVVIIGCYTAIDWIRHIIIFINILWCHFDLAYSAAIDEQLHLQSRSSLLLQVVVTTGYVYCCGLFSSSPWLVDFSITIGGFLHHHWWVSTSSLLACLRHHWLVSSPSLLAYYSAADGRLRLLHQPPHLSPTDYFAAMAAQLCRCCWAPSSFLLADLSAAD